MDSEPFCFLLCVYVLMSLVPAGDRWESPDAAAERHDHEVHGSEAGAGAEALPSHRSTETRQTVRGAAELSSLSDP